MTKVLLIGGTGLLGRSFCRQAAAAGIQITAMVRDPRNAEPLQEIGVRVEHGSIFDPAAMRKAAESHDTVLNFASAIPRKAKTAVEDWEAHNRIRIEGTANLLDAIRTSPVFYCQAGFTFVYGDHEGAWVDETASLKTNAYTDSSRQMEQLFFHHPGGMTGVSFRFSAFYDSDAWHTRYMLQELRNRRLPILGDGNYFWNLIHVDDAAAAVLKVLQNRKRINRREIINVSDDRPVLCKEFLHYLCGLFQVSAPPALPMLIARFALGKESVEILTASYRCKNGRIRELGWQPRYATFRDGFSEIYRKVAEISVSLL